MENGSIKFWAEDDRPREKLLLKGKHTLSNAELLAILIGTGTKNTSALQLGQQIIQLSAGKLANLSRWNVNDLKKVKGIGEAKAVTLLAALELGRRRKAEEAIQQTKIISSQDAFAYFEPILSDLHHEEFWMLLLNRGNVVIELKQISSGGITGTVADPRMIFKTALESRACNIVLCHNHPSGTIKPSAADISLTRKLKEAGLLLDILVSDHLIIGQGNYFSFADEGMM